MSTVMFSIRRDSLPLARVLIFILANGFLGLMVDIRVEHVDAVRDHAIAWLPIIYSAFMCLACAIAFVFWSKTTRRIMIPLFLVAFVVGGIGFFFHNRGNLKGVVTNAVKAWSDPNMNHSDGPPQVAPLAFVGLGVLGALASLDRFNA